MPVSSAMADIQAEEQAIVPQNELPEDITSSEGVEESEKGEEREPTAEEDASTGQKEEQKQLEGEEREAVESTAEPDESTGPKEEQKHLEGEEREPAEPTTEPDDSIEFKQTDTSLNEEHQQQTDQECVSSAKVEGENEPQTSPLPSQSEEVGTVEETPQEEQDPLKEGGSSCVEPSGGDTSDTDRNKSGEEVGTSSCEKDSEIPSEDASNVVDGVDGDKGGGEEEKEEEKEEGSDDGSFATAEGTGGEEELSGSDEEGGGGSTEPQRRRRGRQDDSELSEQDDTEGKGEEREEENGELTAPSTFCPLWCAIFGRLCSYNSV